MESHKLSNFGPCYLAAKEKVDNFTKGHSVLVKSGTEAIKIALQSKLTRGSRVAIPDFTHIGTLSAVVEAGMVPVLFPVNKTTWTICQEALVNNRDKFDAFIVVAPFGYWINWQAYDMFSKYHDRPVFYDVAGGLGMYIQSPNPVCYSFHATKNLSIGEGGCVVFQQGWEAEQARILATFSLTPSGQILNAYGSNAKLDEIHCALVIAWFENFDLIDNKVDRKRDLINFYQYELNDHILPTNNHYQGSPSLCVLQGLDAQMVTKEGRQAGIEFKPYYPLLSKVQSLLQIERCGISSHIFETCLAFPSDVSDEEARQVVSFLHKILQ